MRAAKNLSTLLGNIRKTPAGGYRLRFQRHGVDVRQSSAS
jgi:hypothetical protein